MATGPRSTCGGARGRFQPCEFGNSRFALLVRDYLVTLFIPFHGHPMYCSLSAPLEQIDNLIMFV